MTRKVVYGFLGGFVALFIAAMNIPLLVSSLRGWDNSLFYDSVVCALTLGGIICGSWFGSILDTKLKQSPLTQEDDQRLSRAFVMTLVVISMAIILIRVVDCSVLHLNSPMC
jgi:hypothetical protein